MSPPGGVPPPYGAPLPYGVPPPVSTEPRVARHLQTLGILWCVYGAYRALTGIAAALFLFGISSGRLMDRLGARGFFPFFPQSWMAGIGTYVAVLLLISAALSFFVGFSLMNRKPWGRTLAMIVGILALIRIPVGTALGIYTLWVLGPAQSRVEYDAIAERT